MTKVGDKKTRVLFHYPILNVGGAEMSVLRLTRLLADHGWDVELVLTTGGGNLESSIDPRVTVTYLRDKGAGSKFLKEKKILNKLRQSPDLGMYFIYRLQGLFRSISYLFKKYDAAIVSLHGLSPAFCCRWVRADKRFHWIRNDLVNCDPEGKVATNIQKFNKHIDNYICVSNTAYHSLIDLFPEVKDKALVLYNVLDVSNMLSLAVDTINPFEGYVEGLQVVTVCRLLDQAKGLYRMLDIHKRLADEGINFYWFIVGDGPDRERLQEKIKALGLENRFILLGHQINPFPYYKYADISATFSYYEGLCGSINEAKVMGRPVIATRFSGIDEQISNEVNGLIVNNDEQSIYQGMKRLLTDSNLRKKLTNDILPGEILDDENKVAQLAQLIEENKKTL